MQRIVMRGYYAYRVTRHGRTTVGIRRKRDGYRCIDQIHGTHNAKPPVALRRFVKGWFQSHVSTPVPPRIRRRRAESDLQILTPFVEG